MTTLIEVVVRRLIVIGSFFLLVGSFGPREAARH